ncbi:Inherit from COG: Nad-dependent epimerase dehydratase [Seminavis robusta]|uniref:Inherit from COG: Nad-dependent epimerase dehydratase n=1 Tax=Seminavis robusta TaxID=568900 RepID=A0A9N8DZK2_9STRA|nr:Inherit from COG: Nad-dependent epimerase dehydratase [Seminavis robusta]|eukprot:Sro500_g155260.1 Inherit from COG: Nad-dependent epimerase dehydratase (349) ;mRNA; f:25076-26181
MKLLFLICAATFATQSILPGPPSVAALTLTPPRNNPIPLRFFVGGLGYCGSRLALELRQSFPSSHIAGCVRSEESQRAKRKILQHANIHVHVMDLDQEYKGLDSDGLKDLSLATHIVETIAPIADFNRDPLLALHATRLQDSKSCNGLATCRRPEYTEIIKETGSMKRRNRNVPMTRVSRAFKLKQSGDNWSSKLLSESIAFASMGTVPADNSNNSPPKYVNRILVDDICAAMVVCIQKSTSMGGKGSTYNLVDDDPAPRRNVMKEARRLLHVDDATDSVVATQPKRRPVSRNTGNKRCLNQRLKDDFPEWVQQRVAPTYREGLAYLLQQHQENKVNLEDRNQPSQVP